MRRQLGQRLRLPGRRSGLVVLLALAGYAAALCLSDRWIPPGHRLPYLWLPTGLAYGLAVALGRRVLVPVAAVTVLAAAGDGFGLWDAVVLSVGTVTAALTIDALRRRMGGGTGEHPVDTIVRTTASLVGSVVGAVFMLAATHSTAFDDALLGQFAGVLVTAPFARSWLLHRAGPASRLETLAMLLTTGAIVEVVSSGRLGTYVELSYLVFPPVVWAALRTGRRGVGAACLVVAVVSTTNLAAGHGPFASAREPGVALDSFLLALALTGLLLVSIDNARRRTEGRFRAMVEHASDIVTVYGADGLVAYQSPSSERLLGYRADELEGRPTTSYVHPDDLAAVSAATARARLGEDGSALLRFRHRDGRWVELDCHIRDLTSSPDVGGILVNARDVTEARLAERELAAAERRYRELVERLPLAVYVRPLDRTTPAFVSPYIEELFGYPVNDWLAGDNLATRIVHPEDRERLRVWFENTSHGEIEGEFRLQAADGRWVWVYNRRTTVRDASGRAIAFQGCLLDITERKRLVEQLQQSQRLEALGLLAGGVAHDFNNLLTAMSGYTELARARVGDERARHDLDEVLTGIERAAELTHQLLAFGRRQTMTTSVIDLNEVVERTKRMLTRLIDERFEIVSDLERPLCPVRVDAGQIEQVLVNLAVNARDAMGDGGTLTIKTSNEHVVDARGGLPPGEYACVAVRDTGAGFDADVRTRLFEPFFTTKEIGHGTGLGLAVVLGIVEQSGGHIVVESEPGSGSDFRIFLPRSEELPAAAPVAEKRLATAGWETILLVEDDDVVRTLMKSMLESQRYRVLAVATPAEALDVAERWDLLLTDVVMPGMSGVELAERLAAAGRCSAVLFTSGYAAEAIDDAAALPGRLLAKPFGLDELARAVRDAIEAARTPARVAS